MPYDERSLKEIKEKSQDAGQIRDQLLLKLSYLSTKLTNDKAKEYLMEGAGRRIYVVSRCIENIFRIYPIGQSERLAVDDLTDLGINLHAFFVNISGLFDNLGWVTAYEYDLFGNPKEGKLGRKDIGLFNGKNQSHLPKPLRKYLQSGYLRDWYSKYSKEYRDALAHRIPLYVPPALLFKGDMKKLKQLETRKATLDLNKLEDIELHNDILDQINKLGEANPFFTHSYSEGSQQMYMHAQVITDYATIEEVVNKFCEHFEPKAL
ncbi:MAG: hypothetical protein GY807_02425 [Gammaproteobacteria bacterium]|nr:hypothetical protein [Gammaproteobacteria bacterium]